MTVVGLYAGCLILSALLLAALITLFSKHVSVFFVLLYVSVIVICMGSLQIACAHNVEQALGGNQVDYLASSFIMFFCLQCVAELCKCKIPAFVNVVCVLAGCILFALVFTTEYTGLFYVSATVSFEDGFTKLVKVYGPLHIVQFAQLIAYSLACIAIIVRSLTRRKVISVINTLGLLATILTMVAAYFVGQVFKLPFDILPVGYVLMLCILMVLVYRIRRTDVNGYSWMAMQRDGRFDLVLFSKRGRFSGFGGCAGEWFPEITELNLDARLKDPASPFLQQVQRWIDGEDASEEGRTKLFTCGDSIISAKYQLVSEATGDMHCIMLMDDTLHQRYLQLMSDYNEELEQAVTEKTAKLEAVQLDIIVGMASIVENRDANTGGHIQRTSDVIKVFVAYLLKQEQTPMTTALASDIIAAAPLHDFGKIGIPDAVLNKPGKFTSEEYDVMKTHSAKGAVIVSSILQNSDDLPFREVAVNIAHYHHERWDGAGYPDKLQGKAIPYEARIMALADVFDALVSKRVYKEAFSFDRAFSIIAEGQGTQFDPELTPLFLACRPQLEALYSGYED